MKINQNIVIDFNDQVDSLRTKLIGQPIPDFCNTEEKENIFFKLQTCIEVSLHVGKIRD